MISIRRKTSANDGSVAPISRNRSASATSNPSAPPAETLAPAEQLAPLFSAPAWREKLPGRNDPSAEFLGGDEDLARRRLALLRDPGSRQALEAAVGRMEETDDVERSRHLPPMMTPQRGEYVQDMLEVMRQRSLEIVDDLAESPTRLQWDVVIVGAGVHGTTLAAGLAATNLSVLVIEKTDFVASTFAQGGERFRLSTPNEGRANDIGGLIQTTDLGDARYPRAIDLAHAATVNLFASGAEVLFQAQVFGVSRGESLPCKVELYSGRSLEAQRVVYATGLEPAKRGRLLDLGVRSEIDRFADRVLKGKRPPRVMLATQALQLAGAREDGLAAYRGKRLFLVGDERPARQLLEFVHGFAGDEAYRGSPAQLGDIGSTTWLTGKRGISSCADFLREESRSSRGWEQSRFVALSAAFRNKITVQPSSLDLDDISRARRSSDVLVLALPPTAPRLDELPDSTRFTLKYAPTEAGEREPVAVRVKKEKIYFVGETGRMLAKRRAPSRALARSDLLADNIPRTKALARSFAEKVRPLAARRASFRPTSLRRTVPAVAQDEQITALITVPLPEERLPLSAERDIEKALGALLAPWRVVGEGSQKVTLRFLAGGGNILRLKAEGLGGDAVFAVAGGLSEAKALGARLNAFVYATPRREYTLEYPLCEADGGARLALPTRAY